MKLWYRKPRKNVLSKMLFREQDFLLKEAKKEWAEIQRGAKREEIIRRTKEAGIIMAKTILVLAACAGIMTVAVVAPNVFGALGRIGGRRAFFDRNQFSRATAYLRKKKFITIDKTVEGVRFEVTGEGMERALVFSYKNLKIKPQKKWDKTWRIVAFDIPDRHKWGREAFRKKLKNMDLYPMQESVFVCPYPCKKEIEALASIFFLDNYIRFIETTSIRDDADLREHFELS